MGHARGIERHTRLTEDPDVRRWYNKVKIGSEATANNYRRMMGRFLEVIREEGWTKSQLTPKQFARLPPKKQADILQDYIFLRADNRGARPGSSVVKKAVVSWLRHLGKLTDLVRDVSTKGAHRPRTYQKLPTKEDLKRVLLVCDEKTRVAFGIVALAGQRIEVLGNLKGKDGLKFRDLPETHFDDEGQIVFEQVPTLMMGRPELNKIDEPWFAFLPAEVCEFIRGDVARRVARAEKVTRDSAVFALELEQQEHYGKPFMTATNIGDRMREAMRAVGLTQVPYIWRSYFSQNATKSVNFENLPPAWPDYWMGHKVDITGVYNLRDAEQLVPEMRERFERMTKWISPTSEDPKVALKEALANMNGGEARESIRQTQTLEEAIEVVKAKFAPVVQSPLAAPPVQKTVQKVVAEAELEASVNEGWVVKFQLTGSKFLVEK